MKGKPTVDRSGYMTIDHPDAFKDLPVKQRPDIVFPGSMKGDWVHCPVCKGHGCHNLLLNQYKAGNPENRHFQSFCSQCWGYGWVKKGTFDETCIHEFKHEPIDMHRYRITCIHGCGRSQEVDSSG